MLSFFYPEFTGIYSHLQFYTLLQIKASASETIQGIMSVSSAVAFNQEKARVGAFSVMVKLQTSRSFVSSSTLDVTRK